LLVLLLLIGALLCGLFWEIGPSLHELRSWQSWLSQHWQQHTLLTAAAFTGIYTLLSAACLPGAWVLLLLAGACFGLGWGTLLANTACTCGAGLAFLASRHWLAQWVRPRYAQHMQSLEQKVQHAPALALLTLRLAPVIPYPVLNLLAGLLPLRMRTFVWTGFVGMLPGTLAYVNAGTQLSHVQSLDDLFSASVLFSIAALALLPGLPWLWRITQGPHRPT
jgi:uncharacterized membrane protein YdjX (TVP38/TMEM64 family)